MYEITQLRSVDRPDVAIIHDVQPGRAVEFGERMIRAYDPHIRPVPGWEFFKSPAHWAEAVARIVQMGLTLSGVAKSKDAPSDKTQEFWTLPAEALGVELPLHIPARPYTEAAADMKVDKIGELLGQFAATRLLLSARWSSAGYAEPSESEAAIAQWCLLLAWENLTNSGHLTQTPEAPLQTDKQLWGRINRGSRLTGVMQALMISLRRYGLKLIMPLLQEPAVKQRAVLDWGYNAEEMMATIEAAAKGPIPAPFAWALRTVGARTLQSPWGRATRAYGVPHDVLEAVSDVGQTYSEYLGLVHKAAFDLKRAEDDLKADARIAYLQAQSALRLVEAGGPVPMGLYGEDLNPIHMDSVRASNSLGSLLDVCIRPTLPVQLAGGSPWIGDEAIVTWETLSKVLAGTKLQLHIEPERAPDAASYATRRTSGRMLRPISEWQGEADIVRQPATLEGVAQLFGVKAEEMIEIIKKRPDDWSHLFEYRTTGKNGGVATPLPGLTEVFASDWTQRGWLRPLTLPRQMWPTKIHVFVRGELMYKDEPRMTAIRTLDVPVADSPVQAVVDSDVRFLLGR